MRRESPARAISSFVFFLDRLSLTSAFHSARFLPHLAIFTSRRSFFLRSSLGKRYYIRDLYETNSGGKQRRRLAFRLSGALSTAREAKKKSSERDRNARKNAPSGRGNKAFRIVVGHNFRSFRDRISSETMRPGYRNPRCNRPRKHG